MSNESPTRTEWDLRVPTADQMPAFLEPISLAFAEESTGPQAEDWLKLLEPDRWLAAFDGAGSELAVGTAGVIPIRLTIPGGEVPAAAVTGVGVRPDRRRRGVLSALMRRQLDDVHAAGEPVAVLWASEGAIYQRFGYGFSAGDGSFEVDPRRTHYARPYEPEGQVRLVSEEASVSLVPAVYEAMRAETPGAITRSDEWWKQVLADPEYSRRGASQKFRAVYEAEGQPEGYALYRVKGDWNHLGPQSVLQVSEAVTTTPRALRELWRFLFEIDLVRSVKVTRVSVPTPLQHLLVEPRALGLIASDGLWARLVDLPAALAARRYGSSDDLVLEVGDGFCEWNAGRWRLRTSGEPGLAAATVERTEAPADVVLDTTDLAAIYLGGTAATLLAAAGRIEECNAGAVRRLGALFAAERVPWCVSMF